MGSKPKKPRKPTPAYLVRARKRVAAALKRLREVSPKEADRLERMVRLVRLAGRADG